MTETELPDRHEQRDINVGALMIFAASLVAALVVIHFVARSVFRRLALQPSGYPPPSALTNAMTERTGPRLLVNQSMNMDQLRAAEEAALNSYGWVDRNHDIVHIPIGRAIDLLVETNRDGRK